MVTVLAVVPVLSDFEVGGSIESDLASSDVMDGMVFH